jgi:hypothetical protein
MAATREPIVTNLYWAKDSIDITLPEAIEWLQGLLAEVPPEYHERTSFEVELDYGICDDPTELSVRVCWSREETQEEADAREAEALRRREQSARDEMERARRNYERLKAMFGE